MATVDAGWSWVIAASCCWVTFVIQGLVRCSGVVFVSLIDTFHVNRAQAAWPFTLRMAVWNLSGPIAGALSYRWSIRAITFTGVLIVTLGNVLCWFASEITIVTLFLGALQGFGVGMAVTLIPVIINQYFVKYKSTGAGIACAGATAGSFALPPIVEYAIEEYGLKGAFLMMGGITLHGILGAALLRPAHWLKKSENEPTKSSSSLPQQKELYYEIVESTTDDNNVQSNDKSEPEVNGNVRIEDYVDPVSEEAVIKTTETQITNGNVKKDDTSSDNVEEEHDTKSTANGKPCKRQKSVRFSSTLETDVYPGATKETECNEDERLLFTEKRPPIIIKKNNVSSPNPYGQLRLHDSKPDYDIEENKKPIRNRRTGGLMEPVKAAYTIIKNPMFLIIASNYSVFFLSYMTYLIVIVDYSLDLGIDRTDSVFLVSTFSIADLCGRLGSGWITDSGIIKRKHLMMCNMVLVGCLLIATSFTATYMTVMAVSVSAGLVVGVNLIIFYALLEEYLGLSQLPMAIGLMNFFIGVISMITPVLTGFFRDTLGTYDHLFHFLGALTVFCGLLWLLEPIHAACKKDTKPHSKQNGSIIT